MLSNNHGTSASAEERKACGKRLKKTVEQKGAVVEKKTAGASAVTCCRVVLVEVLEQRGNGVLVLRAREGL